MTGVDLPTGAPLAIVLVVLFSLLGYLLYACAFAVAGSVVSRQEDLQGSSAPLTVLLVAGFILTQTALDDPNGTLSKALSIVPLTAPLAMPSRVALTDVPAWEIALSAGLTLPRPSSCCGRSRHLLGDRAAHGTARPAARGTAPGLAPGRLAAALRERELVLGLQPRTAGLPVSCSRAKARRAASSSAVRAASSAWRP